MLPGSDVPWRVSDEGYFCWSERITDVSNAVWMVKILKSSIFKRKKTIVFTHTFHTQTNKQTLTRRNRRVPRVVAEWCAVTGCCGVAYETITTVTSPAHHAVNMAAALRGDGAMERRVWGWAVQGCNGGKQNLTKQDLIRLFIRWFTAAKTETIKLKPSRQ